MGGGAPLQAERRTAKTSAGTMDRCRLHFMDNPSLHEAHRTTLGPPNGDHQRSSCADPRTVAPRMERRFRRVEGMRCGSAPAVTRFASDTSPDAADLAKARHLPDSSRAMCHHREAGLPQEQPPAACGFRRPTGRRLLCKTTQRQGNARPTYCPNGVVGQAVHLACSRASLTQTGSRVNSPTDLGCVQDSRGEVECAGRRGVHDERGTRAARGPWASVCGDAG